MTVYVLAQNLITQTTLTVVKTENNHGTKVWKTVKIFRQHFSIMIREFPQFLNFKNRRDEKRKQVNKFGTNPSSKHYKYKTRIANNMPTVQ